MNKQLRKELEMLVKHEAKKQGEKLSSKELSEAVGDLFSALLSELPCAVHNVKADWVC